MGWQNDIVAADYGYALVQHKIGEALALRARNGALRLELNHKDIYCAIDCERLDQEITGLDAQRLCE